MKQRPIEIYEQLCGVYQDDPDEFERIGKQIIQDTLSCVQDEDQRLKLQRLQFRIDRELRHYKDPIARMNKMCELFWEGFNEFQRTLNETNTTMKNWKP